MVIHWPNPFVFLHGVNCIFLDARQPNAHRLNFSALRQEHEL